jgi:hypothetical protein
MIPAQAALLADMLETVQCDLEAYSLALVAVFAHCMGEGPLDVDGMHRIFHEAGLLEVDTMNEPCGPVCPCAAEAKGFPFECFHPTPSLERAANRVDLQREALRERLARLAQDKG